MASFSMRMSTTVVPSQNPRDDDFVYIRWFESQSVTRPISPKVLGVRTMIGDHFRARSASIKMAGCSCALGLFRCHLQQSADLSLSSVCAIHHVNPRGSLAAVDNSVWTGA